MREVINLHIDSVRKINSLCPRDLSDYALQTWREAATLGEKHGYRNAQVTVLAPTGTIGFLMDCDTTGIEPAIGLVAYKQLAGGGFLTLPMNTVPLSLQYLGYSSEQIQQICKHLQDHGTLEDITVKGQVVASGLKPEHLPVFDTAFNSGSGKRVLSYHAHIDMMAAMQPFLSGGISKTINMPHEATVEDIKEAYIKSWRSGIKGVAIYRDGSKRSAPVSTKKDEGKEGNAAEKEVQIVYEPVRRKMPDTRESITHKFSIGGSEGYLTVGKYEDGGAGEVFIQMAKAGSTINGLMDTIGTLLSLCLQYGVPLDTLVKKFSHVRFEPEGLTRNRDIPMAKSVMDYLARWLGMEFINGYREQMSPAAKMESESIEDNAPTAVVIDREDKETYTQEQLEMLVESEGNLTCPECGSSKVKVTGTCACCLNCGTSLGCS